MYSNNKMPKRSVKPSLVFEKNTTHWVITGKTFEWKDKIKAMEGARWNAADKVWNIPLTTNIDSLQGDVLLEMHKRRDAPPPPKPIPSYGQCCEKAVFKYEYEQGPTYYLCEVHGRRPTTKKGYSYTGD